MASTKEFEFDGSAIGALADRKMGIKKGNENDPVSPAQAAKLARLLVAGVGGYEYPENAYQSGVAIATQALANGDISAEQFDTLGLVPDTHRALATMVLVIRGRGKEFNPPATKQEASDLITQLEDLGKQAVSA